MFGLGHDLCYIHITAKCALLFEENPRVGSLTSMLKDYIFFQLPASQNEARGRLHKATLTLASSHEVISGYRCTSGHRLVSFIMPHIARGLFNAFAANFARDVTSEARASKDSSSGGIFSRKRISSVGSHPNIEEGQEEEDVAAQLRDRESYKLRKLTGQHK